MWLRRIGLPPLWPSRLKVTLMAVLQTSFIYSFTSYLINADVDYLDLTQPKVPSVTCRETQPMCKDVSDSVYGSPLECLLDNNELLFGAIQLSEAMPKACPTASGQDCGSFQVSIRSIHEDLGRLHTTNRWLNPLRLWAFLFALLTGVFIFAVALHDHALIMPQCRPFIKSLRSLQREQPVWWAFSSHIQLVETMHMLRRKVRIVWIVLLPVWWLYRTLIFVTVVYPITWMVSQCKPIGMSRLMVFCTALIVMITALGFILSVLFLEGDMYGLFWNASNLSQGCVCFCEYPLASKIKTRLVFLGIVVFIGAFSVAFRSFKGLRRANWGNLFSVLYSVPVEVFPVVWERPKEAGGGPIRFRKEGEVVQGEPAFDPFCLMDEQPESGASVARLRPEPQTEEQRQRWAGVFREPEIGCCGFPLAAKVEDESTALPEGSPGSPTAPVSGVVINGLPPDEEAGGAPVVFEGGSEAQRSVADTPPATTPLPPMPFTSQGPTQEPASVVAPTSPTNNAADPEA